MQVGTLNVAGQGCCARAGPLRDVRDCIRVYASHSKLTELDQDTEHASHHVKGVQYAAALHHVLLAPFKPESSERSITSGDTDTGICYSTVSRRDILVIIIHSLMDRISHSRMYSSAEPDSMPGSWTYCVTICIHAGLFWAAQRIEVHLRGYVYS